MKHVLQPRSRKRWLPAAALLAGLLPLSALGQTTTFTYSNTARTYVVPAGVTQLQVTATGGAGGRYDANTDYARGAVVTATIAVIPGETLTINTGGRGAGTNAANGTNAGGTNGGGQGTGSAGGGGGATDVRRATARGATTDYLTSRNALLVAAGGGGGDSNAMGGAAGTPTGGSGVFDAATTGGQVGGGATQTAPGGSGTASGTNGTGGNGSSGGGGGGGYYGGGGGVPSNGAASGGGGSSWVSPTALVGTVSYSLAGAADNGQVVLTVAPPSITSVVPAPGGLGQLITLTGNNLSGVTSLTVNGATATAAIASNTANSLTFRVPATAAPSGTISLTNATGTASTAFTLLPAPGNALNFDGTNDYVTIPRLVQGSFTIEYWLRTSMASPIGQNWYNGIGLVDGEVGGTTNDFGMALLNNHLAFGVGNYDVTIESTTAINDGLWHHVAVTRSNTTGVMQIYIDGVLEKTGTNSNLADLTAPGRLVLGSLQTQVNGYLNGTMDELRFYNTVLTPANIQADRVSTSSAVPGSLVAYYNFDAGTPGGTNTGLSSLYDQLTTPAATNTGTLTNFALAGATSNWVESYAMVVPKAAAATGITATGFTANWSAPALGTVTGYFIDVATTPDFGTPVGGSPFAAGGGAGSQALSGLAPSTTYYYRVRADKTSVTGQGAPSTTIAVTTLSNVATLSSLVLSAGAISPAFSAATTSYTLTVPAATTSTTVTPTVTQANATVTVNGTAVASGTASGSIALAPGATTTIPVVVTAQDGSTKTYTVAVTRCVPQAVAQNVTATLGTNGTATVTAAQVNNNSTSTCGTLTYSVRRVVSAVVAEGGTVTLTAPAGMTFSAVTFASYGTPTDNGNDNYSINAGCHASSSQSVAEAALLGKNSGTITADNTTFGDPCYGTPKRLVVQAVYTAAAPSVSYACTDAGASNKVLLTVTDANGYTSAAIATVTVQDTQAPTAVAQNVTATLDASGNATITAAQVNNGSSDNCAISLSVAPSTFSCADVTPTTPNAALTFNTGSQPPQYVAIGNAAPVPTGNSSYTIEAWVKPVARGNYGIIGWGNYSNNNQVNALRLSDTGLRHYWWANDLDAPTADLSGAWHHVAATYDQATNTRRLYLDGVQVAQDNPAGTHAVPNANNLRIGSTNFGEYFPGSIDEVRVWNVARTGAQIAATRGSSLPGTTAGLVLYYRLNEGSGTTLADATSNPASVGTLVNSPAWITPGAPVAYGQPVTLTVTDASGNASTATAVVTVAIPASATTTTWKGTSSTSWTDCANWSYGLVPSASVSVVIPASVSRYPSLPAGTYLVNDLTIASGASLTTASGATLQVNGNFSNSSTTASFAGTVAFVGSGATQILGGSTSTGFTTVVVNKPAGTVQLTQNLTINSALTLTSGTLTTTGSYQVNLGNSASLSESNASYVVGKVVVRRSLVAGTTESFSGLGLTLAPAAGSTAPGSTLVTRVTGTTLTGVGTSKSAVARYFDIQPTTNTGLNVTMTFSYFEHEWDSTVPKVNLQLFKSTTTPSGPWTNMGVNSATTSSTVGSVIKTGLTDFSIWTLGNSANPLPVQLVDFTAQTQGAAVALAWHTATEANSDLFEIERSLDGVGFAKLGTVFAHGTTTAAQSYAYRDAQLPGGAATLYYRLRQVDLDGTATYSPVRTVAVGPAGLALFPNPAATHATLTGAAPSTAVLVFDALGRVILTATTDATGTAQLAWPAGLPSGVYLVRAGQQATRLTVE